MSSAASIRSSLRGFPRAVLSTKSFILCFYQKIYSIEVHQIVDHAVYDLVNHMVDHVVHEWSTILLDFFLDYIVDRVVHHMVQFY